MNTQEKYLQRQLEQIAEEEKTIQRKYARLQHRFNQLQKEKVALQEDLKRQTSQTRKREDLAIVQLRRMNLTSTSKKS